MAHYNTKQRQVLLDFFNQYPHDVFATSEIVNHLKPKGISESSIYRNLADLEMNGQIRKVSKKGTREAHYSYLNAECCKDKIHLFCTTCKNTTHLDIMKAEEIQNEVLQVAGFKIDTRDTVIYGTCENCK